MSDKHTELQELDRYIAEHVMGWRWFAPSKMDTGVRLNRLRFPTPDLMKYWFHCGCTEGKEAGLEDQKYTGPRWSDDRAAAMQVLEKCVQKVHELKIQPGTITESGAKQNGWWIGSDDHEAQGETLPEAICRFAKAVWEHAALSSKPVH